MTAATTRRRRAPRRDALVNQQRLLDAATIAVHREGPGVPMATVAADAGVGIGTLYRHFPTREALMDGLTTRSFERVLANARAAEDSGGTGLLCIDRFISGAIAQREDLVLPLGGGPPVTSARARATRKQAHTTLQRLIDRGRADGSVRDGVTPMDIVLFGAMLAQPGRPSRSWDVSARRLKDVFVRGLG